MNRAVVNIDEGGGKKKKQRSSTASIQRLPDVSVANGCGTTEATDVMFPDPRPQVVSIHSQEDFPQQPSRTSTAATSLPLDPRSRTLRLPLQRVFSTLDQTYEAD
ncbi:uncharacterized protein UV8b_07365 [Ustilaginoidea virens]|uniref:Uncharacterized protein n=1 Tax=Ustilaginoidea virens TaxID=1159556 RepID=A0A8E5HWZ5_USTVR|nr:uncharacterized protein UV8b_07365 [Ustilaginoidea virens]QUC23124.1 hypothetical protein UV8b_07365 [Ustilaginoidea virens]